MQLVVKAAEQPSGARRGDRTLNPSMPHPDGGQAAAPGAAGAVASAWQRQRVTTEDVGSGLGFSVSSGMQAAAEMLQNASSAAAAAAGAEAEAAAQAAAARTLGRL